MSRELSDVTTLTLDMFGTVLNLSRSLVPALRKFLVMKRIPANPTTVWETWRTRQRLDQYQDTILMLGHTGYLDSARRALIYTLRRHAIPHDENDVLELIQVFSDLEPFADAQRGLVRLAKRYRLVALSNGNDHLVHRLVNEKLQAEIFQCLSVDRVGRFKPHPSVYRMAAAELESDPCEILMVASHGFDVLGARACGYRGAYVNRYGLPYDVSGLVPDLEVGDFEELADVLLRM